MKKIRPIIVFPAIMLLSSCVLPRHNPPTMPVREKATTTAGKTVGPGGEILILENRLKAENRHRRLLARRLRKRNETIRATKDKLKKEKQKTTRLDKENKELRRRINRLELTLKRLERLDQEMEKKRMLLK